MLIITLIKQATSLQVAHLYEHLFCDAVIEHMLNRKMLVGLDYRVRGRTYNSGLVYIEIRLYTPKAEAEREALVNLRVHMGEEWLVAAVREIVAEQGRRIIGDHTKLQTELEGLENSPWQLLNLTGQHKTSGPLRKRGPVYFSGAKANTKLLRLRLALDDSARSLLPLFWMLSALVSDNLTAQLGQARFGYYFLDDVFLTHELMRVHKYKSWVRYSPKLTDELGICKQVLKQLLKHDLIVRFCNDIQSIDYEKIDTAPDELKMADEADAIVGAAGWKELGTEENICEVLRHTTLELVYGREKQSFKITELLDR